MAHHARAYRRVGGEEQWIEGLKKDHRALNLPARERAMLDYAVKLNATPDRICREDVETLRQAGLTDREILDLAITVGYFAFANRLVEGLGVELEGDINSV